MEMEKRHNGKSADYEQLVRSSNQEDESLVSKTEDDCPSSPMGRYAKYTGYATLGQVNSCLIRLGFLLMVVMFIITLWTLVDVARLKKDLQGNDSPSGMKSKLDASADLLLSLKAESRKCSSDLDMLKAQLKKAEAAQCSSDSSAAASVSTIGKKCPHYFEMTGDRCYRLVVKDSRSTWADAKKYCNDLKSHIAEPRTREQNLMLKGLALERGVSVWLGGRHDAATHAWLWDSDATPFSYDATSSAADDGDDATSAAAVTSEDVSAVSGPSFTDWWNGEVGDAGDDRTCMHLSLDGAKKWEDVQCDQAFDFVCEADPLTNP